MKRLLLSAVLLAAAVSSSFGWGRLGHATIAEIAERHLTPTARANIEYYTKGQPLATWASWMDEVAGTEPYKQEFAGWHASICAPDCHSPLYVRKEARNCRDGVTAMEWFREYLREYRELPDSVVLQAIKCITHIVGDFHCPAHVRFTDELNELKYNVTFFGTEGTLHAVWDTRLIQHVSGLQWKDYPAYADSLDTWDAAAIDAATVGWAREWFEDCARDVRPTIKKVPKGSVLEQEFADKYYPLAELELRKAGYQLAKALNTIFGTPTDLSGLWYLKKGHGISRSGMTEGDSFVFARPVEELPAGSWVQFCVSLENTGEQAPLHYMVEFYDGGRWVCDPSLVFDDSLAEYSFSTVSSSVRHPSTFLATYRLRNAVSDTLKVRCRVCSRYAADFSTLDAHAAGNSVAVKNRSYVGAYLNPLGSKAPEKEYSVLLVGNSFTYYAGEAFMLQEIAFSQGVRLNVAASLKGGQTFRQHCGLEMTGRMIDRGGYDFAFLQGQSQEPAQFAAAPDKHSDVADAFDELSRRVRKSSPMCRIFIENTWGYPGVSNGGFSSLEEFDSLLEKGCTELASRAGAERSLVGQAFSAARGGVNVLSTDSKHQSAAGSYLKACVTCLTITGKPFCGNVPSCGLPEEDAAFLRCVAEKTVFKNKPLKKTI